MNMSMYETFKIFEKFEKAVDVYIESHPEVIEKLVEEKIKNFVSVDDIAVGDRYKFKED